MNDPYLSLVGLFEPSIALSCDSRPVPFGFQGHSFQSFIFSFLISVALRAHLRIRCPPSCSLPESVTLSLGISPSISGLLSELPQIPFGSLSPAGQRFTCHFQLNAFFTPTFFGQALGS